MLDPNDIPVSDLERAITLERILTDCATGGSDEDDMYQFLRREFILNATLKDMLPDFVRAYRNLGAFWPFIKSQADNYAERRQLISLAFTPLIDYLEGNLRAPVDPAISLTLQSFDSDSVYTIWQKALDRRETDPEGAITIARTLLEAVSKRILDESGEDYSEKDDLPKLYSRAASVLNLAPSQHTEEPIKAILGGAMNLVNGLGTLRNRFSDAHARGGRLPVKPSQRHASLAVNSAGAVATFLVETYLDRNGN